MEGWTLNIDRASNNKGFRDQDRPHDFEGIHHQIVFTLGFPATNNEAEYEVVIPGLKMAATLGVTRFEVYCDSLLVVSQVNGKYTVKDERMAAYLQLVLNLRLKFLRRNFKQISRPKNNHANFLAYL